MFRPSNDHSGYMTKKRIESNVGRLMRGAAVIVPRPKDYDLNLGAVNREGGQTEDASNVSGWLAEGEQM